MSNFRNSEEHIEFRELCFKLQYGPEEKDKVIQKMLDMKDRCEDDSEVKKMIKSIIANINLEDQSKIIQ